MKKFFALLLALTMVLALAACGTEPTPTDPTTEPTQAPTATPTTEPTQAPTEEPTEEPTVEPTEAPVTVMTHEEYMAAEMESAVVVEFYVQATQSWWFDNDAGHGKITVYGQDADGGYFGYELNCTEDEAAELVPGTKIRVTGYKTEWSGEVEIASGATFEIVEDYAFIAEPLDVTALLGTDELVAHQNEKVCFKSMTVEAANDEGAAFLYKWNGSGEDGDDLYFNASVNGATYTFCVESYLTGPGTAVYEIVKGLKVGDVIDMSGFLYWYEGAQPHITSVTSENSVWSHEDYMAAAIDDQVIVEFYVQANQGWWFDSDAGHGKITVYGQDADGGYFGYELKSTEQTAAKLVPGTKIRVTGFKGEWSGEIEIMDGSYVIVAGDTYVAEPADVTELLGTDELAAHQNEKVCFKGMVVEAANDEGAAFLYKWNGTGEDGDDLYFNVSYNGNTYTFCVESYLCGAGTEVYEAVKALQVGDAIDIEGFLYWYEGAQPHVTSVTPVEVTPVPAE